MADSCVLRLPGLASAEAPAEWLLVDLAGQPLAPVARGTLAEAARAVGGRRLIVLVPGGDVALATPEIPVTGGRLLAAVPYALEESLAGEVDTLHFAIGRARGGRVPTAAVERTRLEAWLAALKDVGLTPALLLAETMALPDNPAHVVLVLDGPRLLVRQPGQAGLVLEADPLEATLRLLGLPGSAPDVDADPSAHVLVYASEADWQAHAATFEALRERLATLNVQLLPDGTLPLLAAGAVTAPGFNLLQGAYAVRGDWGGEWSRWRLAAGLFAAFLVLNAATGVYSLVHLRAEERALDQQLVAIARSVLPDLARPDPARLRAIAEGRVRALSGSGHGGLLGTLGAVAQAMGQAPDTHLSTVSYHEGTTDLTLDAPDVGAIDRVQQGIAAQGLQAAMQGTTQHDTRYQGHVQVKGAG